MALKDRPHDPRDRDFIRWSAIGLPGLGEKDPIPRLRSIIGVCSDTLTPLKVSPASEAG